MWIKSESLVISTGELNGLMVIGPVEHKAIVRFRIMDGFGSSINAIDVDYDSQDVTFLRIVFGIKTPEFNVVKRSTNYMKEIVEYHGQNVYIPTCEMCFINCINYFINKEYTEEIQDFTRNENYQSGVLTSPGIQHFRNFIISTIVVLMERE